MTNCDHLEVLKALRYGVPDEVILQECEITPEQLYEIKIEYEREASNEADRLV